MSIRKDSGFTFLELLIAVSIFSISAVAIYSSFNVGIRAWRRAEDSYKVRQGARQALNLMARELRDAVSFNLKNPDGTFKDCFSGASGEASFWRALRASNPKEAYPDGIFKITYKLKEENNKEGAATKTLYRILQSYRQFIKGEEGTGSVLISGLSGFKLEYAYQSDKNIVWGSDWKDKQKGLPLIVKITLSFPPQDKTEAIEFTEKVLIPAGELVSQGLLQ